ncbi:VG15 protein [Streptomyces globisporus]|uniref:VG15 protein n=1 Tax=Streptomyces globisporus TaxID=1908 RepID=UPI0038307DB2
MARAATKLTDAELRKLLSELDDRIDAAVEAADWDYDDPAVKRLSKERDEVAAEYRKRLDAQRDAAKATTEKGKTPPKKSAKPNAAAGRKYAPEAADFEAVLREAYYEASRMAADGRTFSMRLGSRSRKQQQAIRELAAEGFLKQVSRGIQSMMGGKASENYGGQNFSLTPEGEERLRAILGAKGEALPGRPKPVPTAPRPTITTTARPDPLERRPESDLREGSRAAASRSRALADVRYAQMQGVSRSVVEAIQALWSDVPADRILSALQGETGRAILNAVIAGQLSAAQGASAFVSGAMLAQGVTAEAAGAVNAGRLAGLAMDGRPLATLLYLPAQTTAQALAMGLPADAAMARGMAQMSMLAATTIADTSRTATQVAMTAEPRCVSYVRVVKLPACSRCIILAGRQYSYSEGFRRHPKCDCGMEPMSDAEWRSRETAKSPDDLYRSMTPEERHKRFGASGVAAMDNGADMGQVVNARRGMDTTATGKKVSTEGTTRKGIGGKALDSGFDKANATSRYARSKEARLMPEQILKNAHGNRELQIALLKKHGYIT